MLVLTTAKKPFLVALKVTLTLGCQSQYFACVDFEATSCLNGVWQITITDTDVLNFVGTGEAQIRFVVISQDDLDHATEITYTPPPLP